MKGEERRRKAAVTPISSQHSQGFLLKYSSHYTLKTHLLALICNAWIHSSPHPLRAHVHTLVHRHVLDDRAERKCQSDIVWSVETSFENGAAIWNTQNQNVRHQQEKDPVLWALSKASVNLAPVHWPQMKRSHRTLSESAEALTCQQTQPIAALTFLQSVDDLWPLVLTLIWWTDSISTAEGSCSFLSQGVVSLSVRFFICGIFFYIFILT